MGLKPEIVNDPEEAKHFDGYASVAGYKGEAEQNFIMPIENEPNFTLLLDKEVSGFLHKHETPEVVEGVICADGSYFWGNEVVLACGAMTSPRILEDYFAVTGLDHKLPCAQVVGRNFRMHINSALVVFSRFRDEDVLRKTAIFYNDKYPHSTVQCLGWLDGEILATQLPAATPEFFADMIGRRALGFFVTTEDGSSPENRVLSNRGGRPVLDYELARIKPSQDEHEACIHDFDRRLLHAGFAGASRWTGLAGTAHAVGSLVTGSDPERQCRRSSRQGARHERALCCRRQRPAADQPRQSGADHLRLGAAPRRARRQADGVSASCRRADGEEIRTTVVRQAAASFISCGLIHGRLLVGPDLSRRPVAMAGDQPVGIVPGGEIQQRQA